MNAFQNFQISPFRPLAQHMAKVTECTALVMPMFEHVRSRDYDGLRGLCDRVFKAEHEADKIKDEIRRQMPKTFGLPVFRGDLLTLLKMQDDMADSVEDVAVVLTIKKLELPPAIAEHVVEHVACVLKVCEFLRSATDELKEVTERDITGDGERGRRVLELAAKAEHAEWEADKSQYSLAQKLFALEDEIRATDIFLWSGVFKELGKLANHADKTADRLRRMLAR